MRPIAIILARGGSKGLLRKNLRPVAGRSLLWWAIEAARGAGLSVYVSTDDGEIAEEAVRCKAIAIMRPAELATDEATSTEALFHAVKEIENLCVFDTIVFVEPNYFPQTAETIKTVMASYDSGHVESAISVRAYGDTLWKIGADGYGVQVTNLARLRRQDMEPTYTITGECMVFDKDEFLYTSEIPCGRVRLVPLPGNTIDIHTSEDLQYAQYIAEKNNHE